MNTSDIRKVQLTAMRAIPFSDGRQAASIQMLPIGVDEAYSSVLIVVGTGQANDWNDQILEAITTALRDAGWICERHVGAATYGSPTVCLEVRAAGPEAPPVPEPPEHQDNEGGEP